MPPPPTGLGSDQTVAMQTWLDTFSDGQTATLPAGTYRCDHRVKVNHNITIAVSGGRATWQRLPYDTGSVTSFTSITGPPAQTVITDTTKAWTSNQLVNKFVCITSGARRGQFKLIASNTANTVTCASVGAISNGDSYIIVDNDGTQLEPDENDLRNDCFLSMKDTDGVTVSGIDFVGYLGFFFTTTLEAQHVFNLAGAQNTTLHHCTAIGYGGDAVFMGEGTTHEFVQNMYMHHCDFQNNGRQGISAIAALDWLVEDCTWNYCGRSFVDVEPPSGDNYVVVTADGTTAKVNLDVYTGVVTSATNGSPNGTLTDAGANWPIDAFKNRSILITSGPQAGTYKDINGNTATTITVKGGWTAPAAGSAYAVQLPRISTGYANWYAKIDPDEDGFARRVASTDGVDTFTWQATDTAPPAAGKTLLFTKNGVARGTVRRVTLTSITNAVLGAGNRNGIYCDDITLDTITVTDGTVGIDFGHLSRRPKRLTVLNCLSQGGQFAHGPHLTGVDGITWHDNICGAYQNRNDAATRFQGCGGTIDFISADLAVLQVDTANTTDHIPIIRMRAGNYSPFKLSTAYSSLGAPVMNCGVYVAAGNALYAEPGQTFTVKATNITGGAPTVVVEAGATLGGLGTVAVRTSLTGDVVVTDGGNSAAADLMALANVRNRRPTYISAGPTIGSIERARLLSQYFDTPVTPRATGTALYMVGGRVRSRHFAPISKAHDGLSLTTPFGPVQAEEEHLPASRRAVVKTVAVQVAKRNRDNFPKFFATSLSLNLLIVGTFTKTYSVSAVLRTTNTRTYSADFVPRATFARTYAVDFVPKGTIVKTVQANAVLRGTFVKSFSTDFLVSRQPVINYTVDATIQRLGVIRTYTVNTIVRLTSTRTYSVSAVLFGSRVLSYTADTFIKIINRTKTYTVDAAIQSAGIVVFTVDALLKGTLTKSYNASAILRGTNVLTFSVDASLKAMGITKSYTVDAIKMREMALTYSVGAVLQDQVTLTYSVDAKTVIPTTTVKYFVDMVLSGTQQLFYFTDLIARGTNALNYSVDFVAAITDERTATYTVDAVIKRFDNTMEYEVDVELVDHRFLFPYVRAMGVSSARD